MFRKGEGRREEGEEGEDQRITRMTTAFLFMLLGRIVEEGGGTDLLSRFCYVRAMNDDEDEEMSEAKEQAARKDAAKGGEAKILIIKIKYIHSQTLFGPFV